MDGQHFTSNTAPFHSPRCSSLPSATPKTDFRPTRSYSTPFHALPAMTGRVTISAKADWHQVTSSAGPGVARTLEAVGAEGRDAFYLGEFGAGLLELGGGEYAPADLERSQADWVAPIMVKAWGHELWTVPPNSQGYLSLASAWIAEGLDLPADAEDPLWVHLLAEASKQAGYDRPDVLHEGADGAHLVSAERLASRRDLIDNDRAAPIGHPGQTGDTMYMCAVDHNRVGVSLIQSNAGGWG